MDKYQEKYELFFTKHVENKLKNTAKYFFVCGKLFLFPHTFFETSFFKIFITKTETYHPMIIYKTIFSFPINNKLTALSTLSTPLLLLLEKNTYLPN